MLCNVSIFIKQYVCLKDLISGRFGPRILKTVYVARSQTFSQTIHDAVGNDEFCFLIILIFCCYHGNPRKVAKLVLHYKVSKKNKI